MKKIIFLMLTVFLAFGCSTTRLTPEEKLAYEKAELEQHQLAVQALQNQEFVLEADQIRFRRGRTAFVSPSTNFVMMNGQNSTVQVAFNTAYSGPNGIGGITLDGSISRIETNTDKNGDITYSFGVMGTGLSAQVFIRLINGGTYATVDITPNFSGNRITMTGNIYPLDQSAVFKGRSL